MRKSRFGDRQTDELGTDGQQHHYAAVRLSVCHQNAIFSKTKQFRAVVSIDGLVRHGLLKELIIGLLKFKMAEIGLVQMIESVNQCNDKAQTKLRPLMGR